MSKTLIIVLVVVALIALVGGGLAWAKHRGYCRHGGLGYVQERLSEKLALDASQQEKLQTLGGTVAGLRDQWLESRRQGRGELLELLTASTLDRERAESLLETRHRAWQEHGRDLVAAFGDFSDSLSKEQREQLRGIIEKRRVWHRPAWSH